MTAGSAAEHPVPEGIEVLGTAQRAAWRDRVLPPVEELPGGLWSVPVPIPHNPLRYTLAYLVAGDGALAVVDPGWDSEEGWAALTSGLAAAGASPADVTGIVATHVHPDHHGLTGRLREASGAWVAMHPAERETLPQRAAADPRMRTFRTIGDARRRLREAGAPEADELELLGPEQPDGEAAVRGTADLPEPDVLLEDGDPVPIPGRRLSTVWTPGHTPGHICLRDRDLRLLLTGDHLLPRITPNIGLHPDASSPSLALFLRSLERTAGFDDHDALPAHEYRFRGLGARSRALIAHHEARLRELLAVVDGLGEPTVWQAAAHLTWSRPWTQVGAMRFAALAETEAHLRHLLDRGELEQVPRAEGPARVRTAGSGNRSQTPGQGPARAVR